jgi:hypothetical protein
LYAACGTVVSHAESTKYKCKKYKGCPLILTQSGQLKSLGPLIYDIADQGDGCAFGNLEFHDEIALRRIRLQEVVSQSRRLSRLHKPPLFFSDKRR